MYKTLVSYRQSELFHDSNINITPVDREKVGFYKLYILTLGMW